jgi:glyoxylase-like metal-dependent hydrolase (beta-lactamase superfamily II)
MRIAMGLSLRVLNFGNIRGDWTAQLAGRTPGRRVLTPTNAFLVLGGEFPVLVDAGTRSPEALTRLGLGLETVWTEEHGLGAQLAQHGVRPEDIGLIVQTHLHVDHAGFLERFPMSVPVMVNRRELEFAFSGIGRIDYAPEDLHHIVDRLYVPGALGMLDLAFGERWEILPGVSAVCLGGHTPGSIAVVVDTDAGPACLCGDVIYDVHGALIERKGQIHAFEPQTSGNFATSRLEEKRAIKLAVSLGRFLYPSHDHYGAVIEHGRVTGRIGRSIPGPILPLDLKYATAP